MSSDKEKLNQLLAKVEEINATMNKMSEELKVEFKKRNTPT